MNRALITAGTSFSYLILFVHLAMLDFLKGYFPNLLTEEGYLPEYLEGIYGLAIDLFLIHIVLLAFYIGYSLFSDAVPTSKRYLWAWVIFLGHFVAIPFFWYYYIWNSKESNKKLKRDTQNPRAT